MTEQQTAQEFCREILGWEDAIFYTFRGKSMLLDRPLYEDGLPQPNGRRFYYTDLNQVMEAVQKFVSKNKQVFCLYYLPELGIYQAKILEIGSPYFIESPSPCQALMQAALEAKRRMK